MKHYADTSGKYAHQWTHLRYIMAGIAFLLLCLITGQASADSKALEGYKIPFTYDPLTQPYIVVQASVNGKPPLPFILDTGCEPNLCIDTGTAISLSLPLTGTKILVRGQSFTEAPLRSFVLVGTNKGDRVPIGGFKTISVGDLSLLRQYGGGEKFAGIIGIQALSRTTTRIDFTRKMLTISTTPHALWVRDARSSLLPMKQHKKFGCYYINVTAVPGLATELLLDTGSPSTNLPIELTPRLKSLAGRPVGTGTLDTLFVSPMLLLPSLTLGRFEEPQVTVACVPPSANQIVLGMDMLRRFLVTMDFPNKTLVLERPADYRARLKVDGWIGAHLTEQKDKYIVSRVAEGSPAQKSGLRAGDSIVRIDGRSLQGMAETSVDNLLQGFAGSKAELLVERDGNVHVSINIERISEFAAPPLAISGLVMVKPLHQPITITSMTQNCAGARAGLKAGDIIFVWNGKSTSEMTPQDFADEGVKQEITLTIQRKGSDKPLKVRISVK